MKILISHVFSNNNKGDAALLSVLIKDLKQIFPSSQITVLTMDKIGEHETFEGAAVENSFMYHIYGRSTNILGKLAYAPFIMGLTLVWTYAYRITGKEIPLPKYLADLTTLYKQADLIVPVGGGYIRGKTGLMSILNIIVTLHPLAIGSALNKPTVFAPQSIGPFRNRTEKLLVGHVLKKIDLIIVREDISFQLLKSMGVTRNVVRSIDSGFSFSSDVKISLREKFGIPPEQILVGITVRKWLNPKAQMAYEKAMAVFTDHVVRKYHATVVFIPQVTAEYHKDDDRLVGKKIVDLLDNKEDAHLLMEHYDHATIKAMYSSLDYMIGTRFHSVIFSLTSYVPAIAIEYEHKTSGIMHDLGLDEWVIKIEDVTAEKLEAMFAKLVKKREAYRKHLEAVLPAYIEQAAEVPRLVRDVYERHLRNE